MDQNIIRLICNRVGHLTDIPPSTVMLDDGTVHSWVLAGLTFEQSVTPLLKVMDLASHREEKVDPRKILSIH